MASSGPVGLARYADYLKQRKTTRTRSRNALALDKTLTSIADRWKVVEVLEPLWSAPQPARAREILVDNPSPSAGRAAATHLTSSAELPEKDGKKQADTGTPAGASAIGKHDAAAKVSPGDRRSSASRPSSSPRFSTTTIARQAGIDLLDQAVDKNPSPPPLTRHFTIITAWHEEDAQADLDAAVGSTARTPCPPRRSRWAQGAARAWSRRPGPGASRNPARLRTTGGPPARRNRPDTRRSSSGLRADLSSTPARPTRELDGAEDGPPLRSRRRPSRFPRGPAPLVARKDPPAGRGDPQKIRPRLRDSYWNSRVNSLLGLVYGELGDVERGSGLARPPDRSRPPLIVGLAGVPRNGTAGPGTRPGRRPGHAGSEDPRPGPSLTTTCRPEAQQNWHLVDVAFRRRQESTRSIKSCSASTRPGAAGRQAEDVLTAAMRAAASRRPRRFRLAALADLGRRRDLDWALVGLADARKPSRRPPPHPDDPSSQPQDRERFAPLPPSRTDSPT